MRSITVNGYVAVFETDRVKFGCKSATFDAALKIEGMLVDVDARRRASRGKPALELGFEDDDKWFTAEISGFPTTGRILKSVCDYFLCQDTHDGTAPRYKRYGYRYGWLVRNGYRREIADHNVTNLRLYDENPYPDAPKFKKMRSCEIHVGMIRYI